MIKVLKVKWTVCVIQMRCDIDSTQTVLTFLMSRNISLNILRCCCIPKFSTYISIHGSDMYCEYVIRNNAKSRIQNEWKGPL